MGVASACDRDLVAAARQRDASAFETLLRPLIEPGYRLAYSMLQRREEAEDAVQEAALNAWRGIHRLSENTETLRPWFLAIVVNLLASLGPGDAVIVSTRDGGRTWSEAQAFNDRANFPGLSSVRLRIVWTADGRGIAVLPTGAGTAAVHVVITDDGGATWRASFPAAPRGENVSAGNGLTDAALLADGRGALFLQALDPQRSGSPAVFAYATVDAGRTWSAPVRLDGPAAGQPRAVFALDETHWWASSGAGADLLVTANGGRTMRRHAGVLPAGYVFRSVGFWSSVEGWAVAASGGRTALFVTGDGGGTWWPLAPPA
jgi:photosystem II stability/assembly factor-like uncharacterized protein